MLMHNTKVKTDYKLHSDFLLKTVGNVIKIMSIITNTPTFDSPLFVINAVFYQLLAGPMTSVAVNFSSVSNKY